ncbi:hypothetical protein DIPPA_04462 [Diplonema papillatum]|nr:hypothetical protein DIPPA_04462 [Diplonema papillatum]
MPYSNSWPSAPPPSRKFDAYSPEVKTSLEVINRYIKGEPLVDLEAPRSSTGSQAEALLWSQQQQYRRMTSAEKNRELSQQQDRLLSMQPSAGIGAEDAEASVSLIGKQLDFTPKRSPLRQNAAGYLAVPGHDAAAHRDRSISPPRGGDPAAVAPYSSSATFVSHASLGLHATNRAPDQASQSSPRSVPSRSLPSPVALREQHQQQQNHYPAQQHQYPSQQEHQYPAQQQQQYQYPAQQLEEERRPARRVQRGPPLATSLAADAEDAIFATSSLASPPMRRPSREADAPRRASLTPAPLPSDPDHDLHAVSSSCLSASPPPDAAAARQVPITTPNVNSGEGDAPCRDGAALYSRLALVDVVNYLRWKYSRDKAAEAEQLRQGEGISTLSEDDIESLTLCLSEELLQLKKLPDDELTAACAARMPWSGDERDGETAASLDKAGRDVDRLAASGEGDAATGYKLGLRSPPDVSLPRGVHHGHGAVRTPSTPALLLSEQSDVETARPSQLKAASASASTHTTDESSDGTGVTTDELRAKAALQYFRPQHLYTTDTSSIGVQVDFAPEPSANPPKPMPPSKPSPETATPRQKPRVVSPWTLSRQRSSSLPPSPQARSDGDGLPAAGGVRAALFAHAPQSAPVSPRHHHHHQQPAVVGQFSPSEVEAPEAFPSSHSSCTTLALTQTSKAFFKRAPTPPKGPGPAEHPPPPAAEQPPPLQPHVQQNLRQQIQLEQQRQHQNQHQHQQLAHPPPAAGDGGGGGDAPRQQLAEQPAFFDGESSIRKRLRAMPKEVSTLITRGPLPVIKFHNHSRGRDVRWLGVDDSRETPYLLISKSASPSKNDPNTREVKLFELRDVKRGAQGKLWQRHRVSAALVKGLTAKERLPKSKCFTLEFADPDKTLNFYSNENKTEGWLKDLEEIARITPS